MPTESTTHLAMTNAFEESSLAFLKNSDPAYDECATGIANLDKIIVSVSSRLSSMTRGYLLPIVYAYWERFFRTVFAEYLRSIELLNAHLGQVHPQLAKFKLRRELNEVLRQHSVKQLQEIATLLGIDSAQVFCDNLAALFTTPITFSDPTDWIETESNVNFYVLETNCNNLGIDIGTIKKQLNESKITLFTALKELVDARNQISHGERFRDVDTKEWETLKDFILTVMTAVQLELFESLKDGRCLKLAGVDKGP